MKKKDYIILSLLVVALGLTACTLDRPTQKSNSNTEVTTESDAALADTTVDEVDSEKESEITESESDTNAETVEFNMTAELVDREQISAMGENVQFLGSTDSEYASSILLHVSEPVTDMGLWEVNMDLDSEGELIGTESYCVETLKSVTPESNVIVTLELPEIIPNMGIVLTDSKGITHRYCFGQSGKDGSLIMSAYEKM